MGNRFARVIRAVAHNRALTRLLLAYMVMLVAEFGEWLALIVYAYVRGGVSAAGLVAILQLIPSMLLAPLISARLAPLGVARLLALAYAAATATLACCAAAMFAGAPTAVVYGAAVAFSVSLGVSRPLHHVLMPLVVRHPDELTCANVATSWAEGVGTLAGPALAGLLISVEGPPLACAVLAGLCLSTPLLARVRPLRAGAAGEGEEPGGLSDLFAAARVIASRPTTRALIAFPAGAAAIEGAIDLLVVVLAVRILAIGPGAAGYLSAAFGAGGLLGAAIAVLFAGRRLALPLAAAALAGGAALAALALASTVLVAVTLLVVIGAARTVQSVTAQTLLQRSTPLDVIVCAFALIESMRDLGMIFGALMVPLLLGLGGAKVAFVGMACFAPIAVLAAARQIRRIDAGASIPVVAMGTLRNTKIFSALPAAPLETLAREAHYVTVNVGTAVISEGDAGEHYYAITHGSVLVSAGAHAIRRMDRGEGFGEIALLHSVRRTATVTATSETTLLSIGREAFLTAMRAHPSVSTAAERIATRRLEGAADDGLPGLPDGRRARTVGSAPGLRGAGAALLRRPARDGRAAEAGGPRRTWRRMVHGGRAAADVLKPQTSLSVQRAGRLLPVEQEQLRARQAPLKERYRSEPKAARVTLSATGALGGGIACSVQTGRTIAEAGLHPASGGDGSQLCSGDMLLEALVACAGVTLQAVATSLGIAVASGRVSAEGDLDFRGTLGVDRDAPVGFSAIRLSFDLETDADEEQLATLQRLTERYCVVLQTLACTPDLTTSVTGV